MNEAEKNEEEGPPGAGDAGQPHRARPPRACHRGAAPRHPAQARPLRRAGSVTRRRPGPGPSTHHHLLENALELRLHLHHRRASRGRPARAPARAPATDAQRDGGAARIRGETGSLSTPALGGIPPGAQPIPRALSGSAGKCLVLPDHPTPRNQGASRWFRRRGRAARELDPSAPQWSLEPKSRHGVVG